MMLSTNFKLIKKTTLLTSGLFVFTSIIIYFYGEVFLIETYQKYQILRPNTSRLEIWTSPPIRLYRRFYFFHVQNPKEVINGAKPVVIERGPYVYRDVIEKRNIEFIGKYKLKYNPIYSLYFEPSLSIGNESDIITVLNVPFAGFVEKSLRMDKFLPIGFLFDHFETNLFVTLSIKEIISGYYDPLMHLAKVAEKAPDEKFGILLNNGTVGPTVILDTGASNPNNIAKVISWNNKNKLEYWNTERANEIKGTDGSFNNPNMKRDQNIYIFNPEMCRSYSLTYLKDNLINGMPTYDYHLPKDLFSCSRMKKEGFIEKECYGNGVFNLSSCQNGVSSFLSQPHFLNADKKIVESVIGLKPDKDKHDLIFHYEPVSGASIEGNVRLQINIFLHRNENIDIVKNINPVLFPFFWFDEKIDLEKKIKDRLNYLRLAFKVINYLPLVLFSVGSSFVLILLILKILDVIKKGDSKKNKVIEKQSSLMERIRFKNENIINI